ncbi:hypothetical protein ACFL60_05845 [Candidatus Omnitrophota bacterium]
MKRNSRINTYFKLLNTFFQKKYLPKYTISKTITVLATWTTALATVALAYLAYNTAKYAEKAYVYHNKAYKLQDDYYKKITRPFVSIDSVCVIQQDSLFDIKIILNNAGNLPAKNIRMKYPFEAKINTTLLKEPVIELDNSIKSPTVIFPHKKKYLYYYGGGILPLYQKKEILDERVKEKQFLHAYVFYEGMDGKEYFYMEVFVFDSKKFKFLDNTYFINFN